MTPLKRCEYVRMNLSDFTSNVCEHYKLDERKTPDSRVCVSIKCGMYDLPQAEILVQEQLEECLNKHGYEQSSFTPGLWTHKWRLGIIGLSVDCTIKVLYCKYLPYVDWMRYLLYVE